MEACARVHYILATVSPLTYCTSHWISVYKTVNNLNMNTLICTFQESNRRASHHCTSLASLPQISIVSFKFDNVFWFQIKIIAQPIGFLKLEEFRGLKNNYDHPKYWQYQSRVDDRERNTTKPSSADVSSRSLVSGVHLWLTSVTTPWQRHLGCSATGTLESSTVTG